MVTTITQWNNKSTKSLEYIIGSLRAHDVIFDGGKPSRKWKIIDELEIKGDEVEDELALIQETFKGWCDKSQITWYGFNKLGHY